MDQPVILLLSSLIKIVSDFFTGRSYIAFRNLALFTENYQLQCVDQNAETNTRV